MMTRAGGPASVRRQAVSTLSALVNFKLVYSLVILSFESAKAQQDAIYRLSVVIASSSSR
jgi:hypothetical protein